MSVEKIMGRDLARIARDGDITATALFGRPNTDSKVLWDANFLSVNSMTPAQWKEREHAVDRQNFEDETLKDLTGEPPADICDVKEVRNGITQTKSTPKSLPGQQRERFAKYHAWRAKLASELEALEKKRRSWKAL
jgi:hypothetical protein